MPIRINLLAEAQAAEDLRRRDPVKRAIWIGAGLVILLLAYSSSLQLKSLIVRGDLNRFESQLASRNTEYQKVLQSQEKLALANQKLASLQQLTANRLLYGTLLNALQQSTIDDVQLTLFRVDQSFAITEEVKAKTNNNEVVKGKPASSTEKVTLTMEAKDTGPNAGDQIGKYKRSVAESPYFQPILNKTNEIRLANFSPPTLTADGKAFVLFTLECRFPDRTR